MFAFWWARFTMSIIIIKMCIANFTNWGTQTSHAWSLTKISLIVPWIRLLEKNCSWGLYWQWLAFFVKENEAWVTFWTCCSRRAFITIIHTFKTLLILRIKHMRTLIALSASTLFAIIWTSFTAISIKIGHHWTNTLLSVEHFSIWTGCDFTSCVIFRRIPHHTWLTFCNISIAICTIVNIALFTSIRISFSITSLTNFTFIFIGFKTKYAITNCTCLTSAWN